MTTNNGKPVVSVVMSVHNGRPYLADSVESILGQTFRDFEFIIVDDGSTDGSSNDLFALCNRDNRIRLIRHENQGLTRSLNVGINAARGKFIARMDCDDVAHPDRLKAQLTIMEEEPTVVLLGSEVSLITADGVVIGPRRHPLSHRDIRKQLLLGNGGALTHPAVVIRRTALDQAGVYDEEFSTCQDLDLFLRLTEIGEARNLSQTLLCWRQHPGSINRNRSESWRDMKRLAISKCLRRNTAERFADELFPDAQEFSFPSDPYELAMFARKKGELRSAYKLFLRAARANERRSRALLGCTSVGLQILVMKVIQTLTRSKRQTSTYNSLELQHPTKTSRRPLR